GGPGEVDVPRRQPSGGGPLLVLPPLDATIRHPGHRALRVRPGMGATAEGGISLQTRRWRLDHLCQASVHLRLAHQRSRPGTRDPARRMDWRSLLPPAPTAGGTSAAIPATPGLRLAGRRAIPLPAALLAATLVALQAGPAAGDERWQVDAFDV